MSGPGEAHPEDRDPGGAGGEAGAPPLPGPPLPGSQDAPLSAHRQPSPWRRLGMGFAHPGSLRPLSLIALGLGLDLLALPPGPFPPAILVADAPFLWLCFAGSRGRWARWTYVYGVLHFAVAFRWLAEVHPLNLLPSTLLLAPITVLAAAAIRWGSRRGVPWLLLVPTVLVLEEIGRTLWLGGMPWPARSLSFTGSERLVASSALLGAYALSFLAALSSAVAAGLPGLWLAPRETRGALARRLAGCALLPLALGGFLLLAGHLRVDGYLARRGAGQVTSTRERLLLVQASIPQSLKHAADAGAREEMFQRHLGLTREALAAEPEGSILGILWPETMVPWVFVDRDLAERFPDAWWNQVNVMRRIAADVPAGLDLTWYLGVIHQFRRGDEVHETLEDYGSHDSLVQVRPRFVPEAPFVDPEDPDLPHPRPPPPGEVPPWEQARHDKVSLVPGGEYTPLGNIFPPLRWARDALSVIPPLEPGADDQEPFALGVLPRGSGDPVLAGTIICFEVAFPQRCRAWRAAGAGVLLNAANYGWFGQTGFRTQVRAVGALRAAETATTVVMAGNTGPTLFFDPVGRPYGRFTPSAGAAGVAGGDETTFREGWVVGEVVLDPAETSYVRWGDLPWWGLGLLALALGLRRRPRASLDPAAAPAGEAPRAGEPEKR